jgi:hypothetical protein
MHLPDLQPNLITTMMRKKVMQHTHLSLKTQSCHFMAESTCSLEVKRSAGKALAFSYNPSIQSSPKKISSSCHIFGLKCTIKRIGYAFLRIVISPAVCKLNTVSKRDPEKTAAGCIPGWILMPYHIKPSLSIMQ